MRNANGMDFLELTTMLVNDNNTANKGKITEMAGKTFDINLPSRKTGTAFAVATADNIAVTGELTFTVTYKSGVKLALTVAKDTDGIQTVNTNGKATTKAAKYLKDGKLVIEHNGKLYNVAGVTVK